MRTLPLALDVADDGLTALVDVDMLHRDLLQRADIPERPAVLSLRDVDAGGVIQGATRRSMARQERTS